MPYQWWWNNNHFSSRNDFGPDFTLIEREILKGIATGLHIKSTGTVQWALTPDDGSEVG